ncbi:MAG: ATP-binding cassette domain-containing protein [Ruminococcaceae bacterium]|nr:ATP-binding cassette domain-containing protein [Oscillospiraceae bacterium]
MLELRKIVKDYPAGDGTVHALKGVSLNFRKSEFIAILGPSGCGKTTMLNIIGGLDKYTKGDLVINGRSTKEYRDRDWDAYRNHSVGFVFQSYNLIPHQSVLQNVELALSLSGVSKRERRKRAKEALAAVGLETQLRKKPGEMSGGQMQRVAIARAIVNNPDIILADEPTGALDSETSVQVMDILKKISEERLVIMVTHNPDLAEKYATRTVRMLDGEIISDSAPVADEELPKAEEKKGKKKKREKLPSLSFATSFGLSLKNLFTKKGRTVLTSFAGSIGIIGIALIYAVSQGTTNYINAVQEDTLSSYPLTLESTHMDMGSLMQTFIETAEASEDHDLDAVYLKHAAYDMVNALNNTEAKENDLAAFKEYIEGRLASDSEEDEDIKEAISGVQYTYNMNMPVYTKDAEGNVILSDTEELMREILMKYFGKMMSSSSDSEESSSDSSSMMSMFTTGQNTMGFWQEMLPGDDGSPVSDLLLKQYDLIDGWWPTAYNEIVIVVDENNEIDDMTLYALGLTTKAEIDKIVDAAVNGEEVPFELKSWSFEEIRSMEFRTVLSADCYTYDEISGTYTDLRNTNAGLKYLYDNGIPLKVTGIIRPSEDAVSSMLSGSIAYTSLLTEHIIESAADTSAVKAQAETPDIDIFTGLPFKEVTGSMTGSEKEAEFKAYVEKLDTAKKAEAYVKIMSIPSDEYLEQSVAGALSQMDRAKMEETLLTFISQQTSMNKDDLSEYVSEMTDDELTEIFEEMISEQVRAQYAEGVALQMAETPAEQLALALDMAIDTYTEEQCAVYHDEVLVFSDSSYEDNMRILGNVDKNDPFSINLYASSFENKDVIEEVITEYNEGVDELSKISYTDYIGIMMSSITTIINAITYVLIAFVSVSLIVSSIMIGVITLISVQERTKEIGILRAIGASKRNVSSMFNAETVIIGFTSGLLGVLVTYALCIPINLILHAVTGIGNLSAELPLPVAVILVVISVLLTLISGIIPSRSAAKKDPVVALRTE